MLQPLVHMFAGAISLRVKGCADVLLNIKESAQLLCEMGYKMGAMVRYDLPWNAKPRNKVTEVEGGHALSGDIYGTGDELSCL